MDVRFRVYVSTPRRDTLTSRQQEILDRLLAKLESSDFRPRGYYEPGRIEDVQIPDGMHELMARCQGAIILGLARGKVSVDGQDGLSLTEYSHLEGGIAIALRRSPLVIVEKKVLERGIAARYGTRKVLTIPEGAGAEWLDSGVLLHSYQEWEAGVKRHKHVFLGYCGGASSTAKDIKRFLESQGVTVLDWRPDFSPGKNLLTQIEEAASQTVCGIFLVTADETLSQGDAKRLVPRDNILFEIGYFAGAKGKKRTLIILEGGVELPADLRGDVYVPLADRHDISSVQEGLVKYLKEVLEGPTPEKKE